MMCHSNLMFLSALLEARTGSSFEVGWFLGSQRARRRCSACERVWLRSLGIDLPPLLVIEDEEDWAEGLPGPRGALLRA